MVVERWASQQSPVKHSGKPADRLAAACPLRRGAGDRGERPYDEKSGIIGNRIVLLSLQGVVLQEIDNGSPSGPPDMSQRVWVHDLLGDGLDELIWCDSRTVRAMRPGSKDILWESREMPTILRITDIQPAGKGYPATVAVQTTEGLIGLAGPTGKPRWRFDAPHDKNLFFSSLLAAGDLHGLPRIKVDGPGTTTCYAARGYR